MSKQLLFAEYASESLRECLATFEERGVQYGDTMRESRFVTMEAVARELGCKIDPQHFRALAIAGMVDIKYWRNLAGFKQDTLLDMINYAAFTVQDVKRQKNGVPENPLQARRGGESKTPV